MSSGDMASAFTASLMIRNSTFLCPDDWCPFKLHLRYPVMDGHVLQFHQNKTGDLVSGPEAQREKLWPNPQDFKPSQSLAVIFNSELSFHSIYQKLGMGISKYRVLVKAADASHRYSRQWKLVNYVASRWHSTAAVWQHSKSSCASCPSQTIMNPQTSQLLSPKFQWLGNTWGKKIPTKLLNVNSAKQNLHCWVIPFILVIC